METAKPLSSGRDRLSAVLRHASDLVTVDSASDALNVDRATAAKTLARWTRQGWLKRIRRGLYVAIPLTAAPNDQVIEDPWSLIPRLFNPGYVGGASAAHHWDLTEQLFRTVFVYTAGPVRQKIQTIHGIPFRIHHLPAVNLFGTKSLWRGQVKMQISDVHRTIIDILDDPAAGGGIRHVADCLRAYFQRDDVDPQRLINYADRLGNGAVFKRLGFLAERAGGPPEIVVACADRLTQGIAKLDPALPSPRIVRRWRVWVPDSWTGTPAPP